MNDDTISRKSVIDAVHAATYRFICGAEDGDEMTDADILVLSINKAVVNAIKALPSVQQEIIRCKDCKKAPKCYGDVLMASKGGGFIYCPVEYCSEAERTTDE